MTGSSRALCTALGLHGLADDPAYATNPARVDHREALVALIGERTAARERDDLIAALEAAGVPAGPINTVADAIEDPQIEARGLRIAPDGVAGLRSPLRFSRSPMVSDHAAPCLGEGEWAFGANPAGGPDGPPARD